MSAIPSSAHLCFGAAIESTHDELKLVCCMAATQQSNLLS
jgi:hypothetical protein